MTTPHHGGTGGFAPSPTARSPPPANPLGDTSGVVGQQLPPPLSASCAGHPPLNTLPSDLSLNGSIR